MQPIIKYPIFPIKIRRMSLSSQKHSPDDMDSSGNNQRNTTESIPLICSPRTATAFTTVFLPTLKGKA